MLTHNLLSLAQLCLLFFFHKDDSGFPILPLEDEFVIALESKTGESYIK